jgi:hypothetical protein
VAIEDWSATAANNSTVLGVNIAENCPAANVNNALRQLMADVAGGVNFSILGDFLASSSLSSARSALGVSGGSTSSNNFGNLTNVANKVPYMTGSDAWSTTDFTSFGRQVVATGDAAALLALLGTGGGGGISGSASSGYVTFNFSGTVFKVQWKDATANANSSTSVTYPTSFSSWSRAWVNTAINDTDANNNNPTVFSTSTTGATIYSARDSAKSITVFAIGV